MSQKSSVFRFRVDDEMLESIKQKAVKDRMVASEVVRRAVEAYCGDPRRPGSINLAAFGDVQPREER